MIKPSVDVLGFFDLETQEQICNLTNHWLTVSGGSSNIPSREELIQAAGTDKDYICAIGSTLEYYRLLVLTANAGTDGAETPYST